MIGALLVAGVAGASADTGELDEAARRRVERGEVVLRTRGVEGFAWPEVTVWRRVAATPAEVMAVYADFDGQAGYMPDMVASRVIAREAPNTVRVSYEYEVPGPNERYTVAVTVRRTERGFEARWDLLDARYARRLRGQIDVEPLRDATLVRYTNRVDPGTLGATLGNPDSLARRVRVTVDALAVRVEQLKSTPGEMDRLMRALSAIVGG